MNDRIYHGIGLMSGTSLDGLDICYVRFEVNGNYAFQILEAETFTYPDQWKTKLKNAFHYDKHELIVLDKIYGTYLGDVVTEFIKKYKVSRLDFVASHGHTIFHRPDEGITLQIGDGNTLADVLGITVISDFRTQDVQLGGQGAPLVPIGDELLFSEYDYCLNLGGFANISYKKNSKRIAFDVCPVNIVLNAYANTVGLPYDKNGNLAASGTVNSDFFDELNNLAYYHIQEPKSLGLEWVTKYIFPLIDSYQLPIKDVLRTFVEHIAYQMSRHFHTNSKILVTGGGAYNTFLMDRMKNIMNTEIQLPDNVLIDFKEALIFAFLGLLKLTNKVNVLSSVTGARNDHSSGVIFKK